ncbi:MAG: hypothetical protein N4A54_06655 [Peptostreptococcaceae bacterium]|jgi:hypothetical protein|nr:hypothetical protein [Peptostreptococcaceae bacterium]
MKMILDAILNQYSYVEQEIKLPSGINFYKHKDKNIASYFIVNDIDCRKFEDDETSMKNEIEQLEELYSHSKASQTESLKTRIQNSFTNNKEASQIDKNTSAIYLIQLSDMEKMSQYRNMVFAIEESPNYFKRYVIPYTESQAEHLKYTIANYDGRAINDILSDIANNEDEYYKLLDGKNIGSEYEFVIRLFSKIPFLQYKFKADSAPLSIENDILQKIEGKLKEYHTAIQTKTCNIEHLIELESNLVIDDESLDKELNNLLGGDK